MAVINCILFDIHAINYTINIAPKVPSPFGTGCIVKCNKESSLKERSKFAVCMSMCMNM